MEGPTSRFGLIERYRDGGEKAFTAWFENRRRLAVLIHYEPLGEARAG